MREESERMPDSERFGPQEPRRGRIINPGDLLKRFLMGLVGSCLFSAIMFFVQVKAFIAFVLAAILAFLGWGVHPPQEVEEQGQKVYARIEGEVKKHALPGIGGGVALPGIGRDTPEEIEAKARVKEAERRRREESETKTLMARADVVGLECDDDWPLEKLRIEVRRAEDEADEAARKKPLLARADKIGLQVDPAADAKTLRHQVEEGEKEAAADADYQAKLRQYERNMDAWRQLVERGPNARCPKCRHALHFARSRINSKFVCPKCTGIFPVRQALANWTPPPPPREPLPPRKNPGLWRRIFG